jgi:hypothetical protein
MLTIFAYTKGIYKFPQQRAGYQLVLGNQQSLQDNLTVSREIEGGSGLETFNNGGIRNMC